MSKNDTPKDNTNNKNNTIGHRLSRDFEELSFEIVKDYLKDALIERKKLTQEQKDGGYDGYFIITFPGSDRSDIVLMEAKLRSNVCSDLRLADFAKTILISINELADSVYITTNLHFSKDTISKLSLFSVRTGLSIFPLDISYVKQWLDNHKDIAAANKGNWKSIIDFLQQTEIRGVFYHPIPLTGDLTSDATQQVKIFGEDRPKKWKDMSSALTQNGVKRNYIVAGPYGIGKTYFIQNSARKLNIIDLNLSYDTTYREIFLSIFFQMWTGKRNADDFMTISSFDEIFVKDNLRLSEEETATLRKILFSPADQSDLDYLNTDILEKYLLKIISPILRRVGTVLYINELHALTDNCAVRFISRIIDRLSGKLAIVIELDTDRTDWTSDKLAKLKNTCFENEFERIDLTEWRSEDASQFLQFRGISRPLARNLVKSFGCNAAILDASLNLSDVAEDVRIADIIKDYSGINKTKYVSSAVYDILENTLLQQYPEMQEVFFNMQIFDGRFYAPSSSNIYRQLVDISASYSFIKQDGEFFVVVKDAYLNAFRLGNQKLTYLQLHKYATQALENISHYSLDAVQQAGKRLQIGMLCGDTKLILENYRIYAHYLHKQKAFVQAKKLLIDIYKYIQEQNLEIDSPNLFFILNLIVESYLNLGDGDSSIDEYLNYAQELIEDHALDWDSEEHFAYDKARYYKKRCGLSLRRGIYKDLDSYAEKGIELMRNYKTERCSKMLYEFWNYKALATKHLVNLSESIQVYRKCLKETQKLTPTLIRWFLTARATYFTYRNPLKAKALIQRVLKLAVDNYNPRKIAHHENNIGSLSLMTLDFDDAMQHCKKAYETAKEYSISTEEGRSQNLLGCLAWLDGNTPGAMDRLGASYEVFKLDPHKTYTWIPLVNLSSLFMELKDLQSAYKSAAEAAKTLLSTHVEQIARINDNDLLFSKNYLALLQILRVLHLKKDDAYVKEILQKVACKKLEEHFTNYIAKGKFEDLVKDSHVILKGHFMLKT